MLTLAIVEDDPVCAAQLKEKVERFCGEYQIALQLKTLTQSLAGWISAGQCFLMEASGRPGVWFVLQLPALGDYPVANRRKGGAEQRSTHRCSAPPYGALYQPHFGIRLCSFLTVCVTVCASLFSVRQQIL